MLNLSSVMLGSKQPKVLAEFYEQVFEKKADMTDGDWHGWSVGNAYFSIGMHDGVQDRASDPARVMFNLEAKEVEKEYERIKSFAVVVKDLYDAGQGNMIATFADPDGNYFQIMSPWG